MVLRVIEKEGIVAMGDIDLGVGDRPLVGQQGLDDFMAARRGEAPVGGERGDEERTGRRLQCRGQVTGMLTRRIEVVERPRDQQVGVRIE